MDTKSILSTEALCLNEVNLNKLNNSKNQIYEGLIDDGYSKPIKRKFYLIEINGRPYWAHSLTGSLYNELGKCMTSNRLKLLKLPQVVEQNKIKKSNFITAIAA